MKYGCELLVVGHSRGPLGSPLTTAVSTASTLHIDTRRHDMQKILHTGMYAPPRS